MFQTRLLSSFRLLPGLAAAAVLVVTVAVVACSDGLTPPNTTDAPATAQNAAPKGEDAVSIRTVDTPPRIEGGVQRLQEVGTYPELAKKAGIEGRVVVQFTVNETGAVTQPQVTKGAHEMLDAAALKAVQRLSFEPGERDGQPVPVQMKLPITFKMEAGANVGQLPPTKDSEARPSSESDAEATLFEKAGIQVVRVLMNENGDLLLDGERVDMSTLPDAVRQRITKDAARAALVSADGAPADRVNAAEARLTTLDLQKVYVQKVGQPPATKNSESRHSSGTDAPESAQLNIQFQPDGTPVVNGTPTPVDRIQHVAERWRSQVVRLNDDVDLSIHMDGDAPLATRTHVWAQIQHAFPGPNVPYIPANS